MFAKAKMKISELATKLDDLRQQIDSGTFSWLSSNAMKSNARDADKMERLTRTLAPTSRRSTRMTKHYALAARIVNTNALWMFNCAAPVADPW